jgi:hypothetical protein
MKTIFTPLTSGHTVLREVLPLSIHPEQYLGFNGVYACEGQSL